ncbi:hypothetical protein NMY22_g6673 [Coprinellus aureogranulatus]|nr:hypothetical protein NMY22_g6673 [Coprinellus aureogranulatus]
MAAIRPSSDRTGLLVEFNSWGTLLRLEERDVDRQRERELTYQTQGLLGGATFNYRSGAAPLGRRGPSVVAHLDGIAMTHGTSTSTPLAAEQSNPACTASRQNTMQAGFNHCCFHLFQPVEAIIERLQEWYGRKVDPVNEMDGVFEGAES